ncbi:MAG: MmcQ/YjbR family DNA-binding protein, partial [Acidimicrobiales bacterium]|nr:MmcQ/YjbR family DNA-binding protein [Acidimicrobiales bacterium]
MAKAGAAEKKLRDICLGFPEAVEKQTWGHPTFRVNDKIFVGCGEDDEGRYTMSLKAEAGMQDALLG